MTDFDVVVSTDGCASSIYCESIDFRILGATQIRRASHVEPTEEGTWFADLSLSSGPRLGPFENRSQAIAAEVQWLRDNWSTVMRPADAESNDSF